MQSVSNNKISIVRAVLVIMFLYLVLAVTGKANFFIIFGMIVVALVYSLWREYIWVLLVLAIPSLALGEIADIPVTEGWVYEASLAEIFIALAAAVFFSDLFLRRKMSSLKIDKIAFILILFLAISGASVVYADNFRLYIFGLKVIVFSLLGYVLAVNLLDTEKKNVLFLYGLALTAIILSAQTFFKFYDLGFSSKFFFERNTIMIPVGPVALTSAMLAFLSPILLGFYFREDRARGEGFFFYLAAAMSILAVFLTLGKGAILSLMAALLLLFAKTRKKVPMLLFASWFLAVGILVFSPFFSGFLERLKTTFVDQNTDFRILEYKTGWEIIKENPVYGIGIGQQLARFPEMLNLDKGNFVNNYIFQALIDLGAIGLGVVMVLSKDIWSLAARGLREFGRESMLVVGFGGAFVCAFLNGMVEVTFYALPYAIIFWGAAGVYANHLRMLGAGREPIRYSNPA